VTVLSGPRIEPDGAIDGGFRPWSWLWAVDVGARVNHHLSKVVVVLPTCSGSGRTDERELVVVDERRAGSKRPASPID
jgi:hypothetical protein